MCISGRKQYINNFLRSSSPEPLGQILSQTLTKEINFINLNDQFILMKIMIFNLTQACLQLETVNLVSDMAFGPLVNANEIGSFIPHLLDGYRAYTCRVSEL